MFNSNPIPAALLARLAALAPRSLDHITLTATERVQRVVSLYALGHPRVCELIDALRARRACEDLA
jgi:hypothetical protein